MAKFLTTITSLYVFTSLLLLLTQSISTKAALNSTEMMKQFLDSHNEARKAVGVPPLLWSNLLSTYARIYSSNERRKDCKLIHSPAYGFGENLFWGEGKRWEPKDAVAAWVAEKQWYNYENNSCSGRECGHYTQIVWRETTRVGCSKIICDSGDSFMACEYYPPGNYIGEKPY